MTRLCELHPLPALILEYRQMAKLKSTYIDALPALCLAAAHHGRQPLHDVLQRRRLRRQFLGRRGAFLGAGRGPLRHLLHLRDGLGDLLDARAPAPGCPGLPRPPASSPWRLLGDAADGRGHLIDLHLAVVGLGDRLLDQRGGVPGRLGAALRQVADLVGHHRKPHARFTGPRRFHRRVQRQDVGLEGDLVDDLDDLGDLAALRADLAHGRHHLVQRLVGLRRTSAAIATPGRPRRASSRCSCGPWS